MNKFKQTLLRVLGAVVLALTLVTPLAFVQAQVGVRVSQLVYTTNAQGQHPVFIVGNNGLYGFPNPAVFYSWGYNFSQIVPANGTEAGLSMVAVVQAKQANCASPLDYCGNVAISTSPRVGQLVFNPGSQTVYLVGSNGLYGFSDASTFYSWNFSFSQILRANNAEASMAMLGLVPAKLNGCSAPLDQIAGTCGVVNASINLTSPVGGESWAVGSIHNVTWVNSAFAGNVGITLSPYIACLYSNPRCMIAQIKPYTLASNISNTGSFTWNIKATDTEGRTIPAGQYMLTVGSADGSVFATTIAPFSLIYPVSAGPVISQLSPSSGPAGTVVTVSGSGFTSTGNTVTFGAGSSVGSSAIGNINSSNGTTLQFTVPAYPVYGCPQSSMPNVIVNCDPIPLYAAGNYSVSVANVNGASNSQTFNMTASVCPFIADCAAPPQGYYYKQTPGICGCGVLTPMCGVSSTSGANCLLPAN